MAFCSERAKPRDNTDLTIRILIEALRTMATRDSDTQGRLDRLDIHIIAFHGVYKAHSHGLQQCLIFYRF